MSVSIISCLVRSVQYVRYGTAEGGATVVPMYVCSVPMSCWSHTCQVIVVVLRAVPVGGTLNVKLGIAVVLVSPHLSHFHCVTDPFGPDMVMIVMDSTTSLLDQVYIDDNAGLYTLSLRHL